MIFRLNKSIKVGIQLNVYHLHTTIMVYTPIMVHTNNMVHTPIIGLETGMLVKWCDCIACEGERAMFK